MSVRTKRNKTILSVIAAVMLGVLLFAVALEVGNAKEEKGRYIAASERLALIDLADAAEEMERACEAGDVVGLNRAAGKAEAYLSRSGLKDSGGVYRIIGGICSGEYGSEICEKLSEAVKKAVGGDGGEALRDLTGSDLPRDYESAEETTEDKLSVRVLERLGRGSDDLALKRAVSFACPNAFFESCTADGCGNKCFKYSGDNVFIAVGGDGARVMMYCFDREVDGRYFITDEEAERKIRLIIEKEKLKLSDEPRVILEDGIYKCIFTDVREDGEIPLVSVEIYSDTGRLRKYDAVNYYAIKK